MFANALLHEAFCHPTPNEHGFSYIGLGCLYVQLQHLYFFINYESLL